MAVNKNFVVKNGLEVNTNLILADVTSNSVGIGTSVTNYKLHVNGGIGATDITVTGFGTISDLSGDTINYTTATFSVGTATTLSGSTLNYSGIATVGSLSIGADEVISSAKQLKNIASLDSTTTATIESAIANAPNTFTNLVVTGVSTLGVTGITTLNVSGIATFANVDINAGDIDVSTLDTTDLYVSGITTLGTVEISSGIVTATSGIVTYYGDGTNLSLAGNPDLLSSTGIGIGTTGGLVGYGITFVNFYGAGVSTSLYDSSVGIATIFFEGGGGGGGGGAIGIGSTFPGTPASLDPAPTNGDLFFHIDYGRTFIYYDEVTLGVGSTAVWIDSAPFNQGGLYVNKYGDNMYAGLGVTIGSLSSPSVYFNGYTNSGFYSPAANEFGVVVSGTERLNVNASGINVIGIATATSFKGSAQVGVATGGVYIGLATQFNFVGTGVSVTHEYDSTVGIATVNFFAEAGGGGGSGQFNTGITSSLGYAVTDSMATAYTAADTVVVHSIHVTNIDGTNSADISGQLYGEYSIAYTVPVPPGSSVELLKQPKVLNTGDTIELQANVNGDLHATISLEPKTGDTTYIGVGTDITSAATYTDLWVATADSVLQGVLLSNDDGVDDVKANVVWTDGADNIVGYYTYEMIIPADATVEVLEQPKFLPSGYKVRVLANQANRLEAILSARTIA